MYEYPAQLVEVIDGDTVDVTVDLGFHIHRTVRLRLAGVDTDEIYGVEETSAEYESGMEHMSFVRQWFQRSEATDDDQDAADTACVDDEWPFIVRTEKKGKYGRYIATVERRADGSELTDELITTFPAVEQPST
jgi:micrococcal nuclease